MFKVIVGVLYVFICDEMEIVPKKKAIRNAVRIPLSTGRRILQQKKSTPRPGLVG